MIDDVVKALFIMGAVLLGGFVVYLALMAGAFTLFTLLDRLEEHLTNNKDTDNEDT